MPSHFNTNVISLFFSLGFQACILCLAFFVVTWSASAICKFAKEEDEPKGTVSKYKLKVKDGNLELDETIEIDTEKKTEKFHIPDNGKHSGSGEVNVIYDFKLNLVIHRLSNQKACFLSNFTDNMPKPTDLKKLLDMGSSQKKPENKGYSYIIGGAVDDLSLLSDEMADLCAKLSIYRIKTVLAEEPPKRQKRQTCLYRVTTIIICNSNVCVIITFYQHIGCLVPNPSQ